MSSSCHRAWRACAVILAVCAAAGAARAEDAAAGAEPATLQICADPNNLPFSNDRQEGFENRIAALLAADLHLDLGYTWGIQRRSFLRTTLFAHECDVVMGVPVGLERVLETRPYYRSSYVFVTPATLRPALRSLDDPALRTLRIGLHAIGMEGANTPVAHALAARGIVANITGFPMWAEASVDHPASQPIDAVAAGTIDVAIVWGPFGGYFAQRYGEQLSVHTVPAGAAPPDMPFVYDLALGVRREDVALRDRLDLALTRQRAAISKVLASYAIPVLPLEP